MQQKIRSFAEIYQSKGLLYALRLACEEYGPGSDQRAADSIFIFPKIKSNKERKIEKINWYLPHKNTYSIWVSTSEEYIQHIDKEHFINTPINFVTDLFQLYQHATKSSDLLVHDIQSFVHPVSIINIDKSTIIDPKYQKESELTNWMGISQKYYDAHTSFPDPSFSHLERAFAEHNRSYIFAPGPSLSNVFDYTIDHSAVKFICNDILLYDEIVEYIRPDVIVLADPMFFGPSEYAHRIRTAASKIINTYGAYLVVPDQVTGLLYDKLQDVDKKIIGLEVSSMSGEQLPSTQNERIDFGPAVPSKMLPIASALTEKVAIIGADGYDSKTPAENYSDPSVNRIRRNSISKWHPEKNNTSTRYEEINQKNNSSFEKWISAGRKKDVTFYCITESNYPVLKHITSSHEDFCQ